MSVYSGAQQPQSMREDKRMPGAQQPQAYGNGEIVTSPPPFSSDVLIEQHRGDKGQNGERGNGVDGAEGVSSGNGLSETVKEVAPCSVRRLPNKGEVLGECPARFIIRRNPGIRRLNK